MVAVVAEWRAGPRLADAERHGPGEAVLGEVDDGEAGQARAEDGLGNGAGEQVAPQVEPVQRRKISQRRGDGPVQLVVCAA